MKRITLYAFASLAFVLAACNRPEVEGPDPLAKGKYELKELTASLDGAATKTGLDETTKVVNWKANDRIAVIGTDGAVRQYQLDAGADSPVGRFVPVGTPATYTQVTDLTAIYPACAVASANTTTATIRINSDRSGDYANYGISSWNVDSQFAFAQNDLKVAKPSASTTQTTSGLNFKFTQLATWCTFSFDFTQSPNFETIYNLGESMTGMTVTTNGGDFISGSATLNLSDLSLGIGSETSIVWNFASSESLASIRSRKVMMFPVVGTGSTIHVTLYTDQHTFEFYGSPTQNFSGGTTLTFPITVDKNFTANTGTLYYTKTDKTRAPFYYYGNQNCYLLTSSDTGEQHIDTTPYSTDIYYHRSNGSGAGATAAASAELLWQDYYQDSQGLISSVSYSNNTITYNRASGKFGNAVIVLKDGSDKVLWSYHIWCPADAPTDLTYAINNNGEAKTLMSMPLGATKDIHGVQKVQDITNAEDGYGLLYQWGRKDPLGRSKAIAANTEDDYYTISGSATTPFGNTYSESIVNVLTSYAGDVADPTNPAYQPVSQFMQNYTRQNPTTFVWVPDGQYGNNWAGEANNYFWGNYRAAGSFPRMAKTYKSIFDPCPVGYRVPPEDTWVGFTTSKNNSSDATQWNMKNNGTYSAGAFPGTITGDATYKLGAARGYAFYYQSYGTGETDFYPASGHRYRTSGALANVGSYGCCWSSAPSGSNARFLYFGSSSVTPLSDGSRAFGFPVRCVRE